MSFISEFDDTLKKNLGFVMELIGDALSEAEENIKNYNDIFVKIESALIHLEILSFNFQKKGCCTRVMELGLGRKPIPDGYFFHKLLGKEKEEKKDRSNFYI